MMSDGEVTTTGFDARVYTARLETISLSNAKIICGEGYKVVEDGCVQCPAGTYLNENRCDFCPIHFYQNLPGQLSCIECSPIKGTYFYGTSSVQYCVEMDRSGRTSAPLPIRIIIGGSVGGLLLLLAMLIAVCFFLRRRANNRIKKEQEMRRKQAEVPRGNKRKGKVGMNQPIRG
uniref:Uncharacterized protein n=1 Tax=Ciona savignyi TaxID=51511 RepID=H2YXP6_CIOSA